MLLRSNNQGPPKNIWESFNFIIKEYVKRHYEELVMRFFKHEHMNILKTQYQPCHLTKQYNMVKHGFKGK